MSQPHVQDSRHAKVIVIGAGLAGLAAADRLTQRGVSSLVLEGSDRIGGRTYGWRWDPADRDIDLGGTWLLPSFTTTLRLLNELSVETYDSPLSDRWMTHLSDGVAERNRLTPSQEEGLGLVAEHIAAMLAADNEITAEQALGSIDMPDILRDWHIATQRYLGGAPLFEIDAAHLLIDHGDLINPEHYATQIQSTSRSLVDALAHRAQTEILTRCVVSHVHRSEDQWLIHTRDGRTFTADAVVLAVPRNVFGNISLSPEPTGALADLIAHPHVGASRKDWFILDGVSEHFRVFASRGPFGYFRSEARLSDGGMLSVGLAPSAEGLPSVPEFEAQIRQYLPEARVREHFTHDWNADEFARGTWYVPRIGDGARNSALTTPHPTLEFVGGDVCPDFPGTFEGAVNTGIGAADRLADRINKIE